jgi:N-acetylglucosamine-6-phosphate deacetylase
VTTLTGRLVLPGGVHEGEVRWEGDRIVALERRRARGPLVLPGFVDLHVHGGGGHSFAEGGEAARRAVDHHARHGTTTTLASLVSAAREDLLSAIEGLVPLVDDGLIAGLHLEGPYLAATHRGAHDPRVLRAPDRAELAELLAAARGRVRMVTLAPELPGALPAIAQVLEADAIVAVGHTAASFAQARDAIAEGATVATHLGNGMPPFHHRAGGPVAAALLDDRCTCELIVDGHHLADEVVALWFETAGADRVALITDAILATGCPAGEYMLGSMPVRVRDGVVRLAEEDGSGPLAGSTLTMDAAVRRCVELGLALPDVSTAASLTPARVLGLANTRGSIAPGKRADLVVLDDDLEVLDVVRGGRRLEEPPT